MKKVFVAALAAFAALFDVLSFMKDTLKTEEDIQEKLDARSMGAISYEIKYKSIRELLRRKKKGLLINDRLRDLDLWRASGSSRPVWSTGWKGKGGRRWR